MKTLVLYDIECKTLKNLEDIQKDLAENYKGNDESFIGPYDMFVLDLPYYNRLLDDYDGLIQLLEWDDVDEMIKYISKILDMLSHCDALLLPKDFAFDTVHRIIHDTAKEFGYRIDAINSEGKRVCIHLPD